MPMDDSASPSHCTCKRKQIIADFILLWVSRVSAMLYVLFGLLTFPQVIACRPQQQPQPITAQPPPRPRQSNPIPLVHSTTPV